MFAPIKSTELYFCIQLELSFCSFSRLNEWNGEGGGGSGGKNRRFDKSQASIIDNGLTITKPFPANQIIWNQINCVFSGSVEIKSVCSNLWKGQRDNRCPKIEFKRVLLHLCSPIRLRTLWFSFHFLLCAFQSNSQNEQNKMQNVCLKYRRKNNNNNYNNSLNGRMGATKWKETIMEWKIDGIVWFHRLNDTTLKSIQIHFYYALVHLYFQWKLLSSSSYNGRTGWQLWAWASFDLNGSKWKRPKHVSTWQQTGVRVCVCLCVLMLYSVFRRRKQKQIETENRQTKN